MPTKKYRVDTDKGSFVVEVEDTSPPPSAAEIAAHGDPINPKDEGGLSRAMGTMAQNPMLQHAAHPQSTGDVLSLMIPGTGAMQSLARIVPETAGGMIGGLRQIASGGLKTAGNILESPITNVTISPKAHYLGKMANALGDRIAPTPVTAPSAPIAAERALTPERLAQVTKVPPEWSMGKSKQDVIEELLAAHAPAPAPTSLSAPEVAQMLRERFGSEQGGRMLYGSSLKPAEREAAITRLAPGPSRVPAAARDKMLDADYRQRVEGETLLDQLLSQLRQQ